MLGRCVKRWRVLTLLPLPNSTNRQSLPIVVQAKDQDRFQFRQKLLSRGLDQLRHKQVRIIGSAVVDEQHLTEDQLLAKAREFYAASGSRNDGDTKAAQ